MKGKPVPLAGWIFWLCLILMPVGGEAAWFRNNEQDAARIFDEGDYLVAAEAFDDEYRRGVALYRAGKYSEASDAFEQVDRSEVKVDALYNLGNSRFMETRYADAIQAYESVLAQRPDHRDASNNLALAQQMLLEAVSDEPEEEEKEEELSQQSEEKHQEEQSEQQQSEQQQESQSESESEQQSGDQEQESEEQSGDQEGEQQQESESQSGEQQQE